MAINPNTDFTSGSVLTAAQQNRFPRGVVAFTAVTSSDTTITVEEIQITATTFTAVASRYYRITYFEPQVTTPATSGATITARIRPTNLAGTQIVQSQVQNSAAVATGYSICCSCVTTFGAASVVIVASLQSSTGTSTATRSATAPAYILVEDIGPA